MAEIKPPVKKRACRTLSIGKIKKNESDTSKTAAARAPSILAFFNNAQPARLACPICGTMVPRYGINKHLDDVCQKTQNSDDNDVILVHSETSMPVTSSSAAEGSNTSLPVHSPQKALRLQTKTSPIRSNSIRLKEDRKRQASPYFKKNVEGCVASEEPRVNIVKTVSLGSLSSKLSRSFQMQGRSKRSKREETSSAKTVYCGANNSEERVGDSGLLNDSQKENWCEEPKYPARANGLSIVTEYTEREYLAVECKNQESKQVDSKMEKDTCLESMPLIMLPSMRIPANTFPPLEGNLTGMQKSSEAAVPKWEGSHAVHSSSCQARSPNHSQTTAGTQINISSFCGSKEEVFDHINSCSSNREILPMESLNTLENGIMLNDFLKAFQESGCKANNTENFKIQNEDVQNKSSVSDVSWQPYYLRNFLMVMQTIMENEDDLRLFNAEDMSTITKFHELSDGSQKLYVRLFQRKLNWLKSSKIEYAEIGQDLLPVIEELVTCGFLQAESELQELSEVLELLSASELKLLAKIFHLANPNGQKQQLVEGFLQLAKQRSVFSVGKSQPGIGTVILKRAKELAGRCIRICRGPRAVFSRILLLFSLTDSMEDEEAASGGQTQLSTVLMVNMGRMTFPTYTVLRTVKIFQDREDLISYEGAMHKLIDVAAAMTSGNWEEAHQLYKCAREVWQEVKSRPCLRYHEQLPVYLRCFTVGWTYTRILSRGVEILQRLHMYEEAVGELESLLSQNIYCPDSRGRWWDRLALNLHQHLKHTQKAIGCIREGLSDPFVRTGHRLALCQRALRMRDSANCKKFRHLFRDLTMTVVEDVTHVTIKGRMCPQSGMGKSVFLLEDIEDDEMGEDTTVSTVMCSVEELALAHYRQQGFDQGIHGEGSTFSTLYCLLMWDIIFMDGIPDVFRNSYQVFPLDLYTDSFFENRRSPIERRLHMLQEASSEILTQLLAEVWSAQEGKAAALINWDRFTSLQQAQNLVSCFGGPFLSGVCQRLSKDLRHCRGGLPDLVVWNTQESKFKLVEVKGPNDRLSHKQMIWLTELKKLGAEVEVCHVVTVGSKSKRLS